MGPQQSFAKERRTLNSRSPPSNLEPPTDGSRRFGRLRIRANSKHWLGPACASICGRRAALAATAAAATAVLAVLAARRLQEAGRAWLVQEQWVDAVVALDVHEFRPQGSHRRRT